MQCKKALVEDRIYWSEQVVSHIELQKQQQQAVASCTKSPCDCRDVQDLGLAKAA